MLLPMPVISELYIALIESNPKPALITSYIITRLFSHLENPILDKVPFLTKFRLFFFQSKYSSCDKLMSPNKPPPLLLSFREAHSCFITDSAGLLNNGIHPERKR